MGSIIKTLACFCFLTLLVAASGCKPAVGSDGKQFQTATPEIKGSWDRAMAAAKTNDFAVAITTLQRLRLEPGMTPAQTQAIDKSLTTLNDQMYEAANSGDEKAKKAINDLRILRGR
jgi:hypothetical protein